MRCAVIDIGTNSVKLLVAEVEGSAVQPLWEGSEQTRLGEGFSQSHQLQPAAIERTARAVAKFATSAKSWEPVAIRVIATSAARDAVNRADLLTAVLAASGLEVEVISGAQEADWAFAGACTDLALANSTLLILDVGGGSTEFTLGQGGCPFWRQSIAMGTVRMLEERSLSDPPMGDDWARCRDWVLDLLGKEVQPILSQYLHAAGVRDVILVGTGGTTTILAAMELRLTAFDRERMEKVILSRDRVWQFQKSLWSLPLAERRRLAGLPPNRADVILFGVAIWALVMETFGLEQLRVSTRGLRFAAALNH